MKTIEASAVISTLQQAPKVCRPNEAEIEEPSDSIHPFGSVLFRLELALALISAGRRQASAVQVHPRS